MSDDVIELGETVFVKSKRETGAVIDNRQWPTLTVRLMTGTIVVHEGDYERR